jgi:dihydroorotate dehydrogenase (fumarate)
MNLTTTYMGLCLRNPLVASASPLNSELANLRALEDAGAAAIVLPSMFAEQIEAEEQRHAALTAVGALSSPEAASYFPPRHLNSSGADRYLALIRSARQAVDIPIIASLNADSPASWTAYASQVQEAGASALELNLYVLATDLTTTSAEVERRCLDTVRAVRQRVSIPVSVKIGPYFSATGAMAAQLGEAGADALVLFNRFYQPDIDVVRLKVLKDLDLSRSSEMRLPLLWLGVLHGRIKPSLAASTGVHTVDDVVKYLLAGADVVMSTSALLAQGIGHMRVLVDGLAQWLERRDMDSVDRIRGLLSQGRISHPQDYERANYIEILQGYPAQPVAGSAARPADRVK